MLIATLKSERLFARWASAEGVSMFGTAASTVVLPVLVYDLTGSAATTGMVFATRLIPYLLLGWIAGPIADRFSRRRLIIGGNLAEGLLVATIPIAAWLDVLTVGQVFAVALLSAVAFVFSDAAVFGAVPALVHEERLASANGVLATLASAADIAGPVIAGVLIATIGPANALSIDAMTFLFAAAVQSTIRSNLRRGETGEGPPSIRRHLATGLRFIRRQRTVFVLIVAGFANSLAIGCILGLLVPWSIEVLGYDRDDARLGVLYAAVGIGSLIAAVVFPRIFATRRVRLITPASLAWSAAAAATLLITTATLAPASIAAFAFGIMLTITIGITYRQLVTPDELTSTVNTVGRTIAAGGQPLGAAIGAIVVANTSITTAYSAAAVTLAVTAVGAFVALGSANADGPTRDEDEQ
ncbi:MAG: MFS transporter [Actinomycetota bacterium]